jgi:Na+-transporting methylmalonyl-CoA/oxaloacetate decarboxylase gamma subunit
VKRRAAPLLILLAAALVLMGHVGSPDVFFESPAGPYPVRIVVRPPEVVPGRAEITVRATAASGGGISGISGIAVQPVVWNAGPEGVPPAEQALPVRGDRSLWSAQLWLMRPTSYSVRVTVSGAAGKGTVLVPVVAVATRRLPMQRGMAIVLAALGAFLLAGALTAIGAAVRESELPPGEEPDPRRRRRARRVVAGTALLLALGLWGGRVWWRSVDASFARTIYRPFHVTANVVTAAGAGRTLALKVDDPAAGGRGWTPLILDHGKLMHLFLVRQPGQDAFGHLHPIAQGSANTAFAATLPPLPAGPYRLYADVTHEDGFSETLTANVDLPSPGSAPGTPVTGSPPDPDDSFRTDPGIPAGPGGTFALGDGLTLTWLAAGPRVAGEDACLRFALRGADGKPAAIEPYMGMLAHAAVVRDDGQVFVHLHPEGTVSMAALQFFEDQQGKKMKMGSASPNDGILSFPWAFPRPGRYHLWVQVRSGGPVRTGVFSVNVTR